MSRRVAIGFDRRLDLEWLDVAAAQAAKGGSNADLRAAVWAFLEGSVAGDNPDSARRKTVTVLNHVWGQFPHRRAELRLRALAQLEDADANERLALHWAMMVGAYPLFTDTATAIGKLLVLQGEFAIAHLNRRLVAQWGERSTLERAAQRIVRSMVQWGVLQDTAQRGTYRAVSGSKTIRPAYAMVLFEALLIDSDTASTPLPQLIGHATSFPFRFDVNANHFRNSPQFILHRQGLNVDCVELTAP
jgi:hypothetical protein